MRTSYSSALFVLKQVATPTNIQSSVAVSGVIPSGFFFIASDKVASLFKNTVQLRWKIGTRPTGFILTCSCNFFRMVSPAVCQQGSYHFIPWGGFSEIVRCANLGLAVLFPGQDNMSPHWIDATILREVPRLPEEFLDNGDGEITLSETWVFHRISTFGFWVKNVKHSKWFSCNWRGWFHHCLQEFIDGAAKLRGNAKALDIWRMETKIEAGPALRLCWVGNRSQR